MSTARGERSEAELTAAYQAGDRAAGDALLRIHDALVTGIVRAFCRRWRRWYPDEEALGQEARILFLHLVLAHDPERGPLDVLVRAKLAGNLLAVLGANSELRRKRGALRAHAAKLRAGEALPAWLLGPISLDATEEEGGAPVAGIASNDPGPAEVYEVRELEAVARDAFHALDPRGVEVLRRRYLIDEPMTQEQVGAALGISRARVGQIEETAVATLRRRCARELG